MRSFVDWFSQSYKVILVGLIAFMSVMLVILAMQHVEASKPSAGTEPGPIPTFTTAASTRAKVSVLSDSHAYNANSWWRQTVGAGQVPDVVMAKFDSRPGADTAALASSAQDSASEGGWVIVQAGTNDLLSGRTAQQAVDELIALWGSVRDAGGKPVAALVPPSDENPAQVVELNKLIRGEASRLSLPLLDVYTPVANEDGTWSGGHSEDGRHADAEASNRMAAAAATQLPRIVSR